MNKEEVKQIITTVENDIIKMVLSDKIKSDFDKVIIRKLYLKDKWMYQVENYENRKVFHKNLQFSEMLNFLPIASFKQILVETAGKSLIFSLNKNQYRLKQKENDLKLFSLCFRQCFF